MSFHYCESFFTAYVSIDINLHWYAEKLRSNEHMLHNQKHMEVFISKIKARDGFIWE